MSYTPPDPCSAGFSLHSINIPDPCSAGFSLSDDTPQITSDPSRIQIFSTTQYIDVSIDLICGQSTLNISSNTQLIDFFNEIVSDPSILYLFSNTQDLEILPDCISNLSKIQTHSNTHELFPGYVSSLPANVRSGGIVVNWGRANVLDTSLLVNWSKPNRKDITIENRYGGLLVNDSSFETLWNSFHKNDISSVVNWDGLFYSDISLLSIWKTYYINDITVNAKYGGIFGHDVNNSVSWLSPGRKDVTIDTGYKESRYTTKTFTVVWGGVKHNYKSFAVTWGPLSLFPYCNLKYYPPTDGTAGFKLELIDPLIAGTCYNVNFSVFGKNTDERCPYTFHFTGRRDSYISGIEVRNIYPPPKQETYYMLNLVMVRRIPDNVSIQVTSINIKYDKQSWLWAFTLTIGKDHNEYLELIKPDPLNADIFTDIEIYINGWRWVCRVETWNEGRVFASDSWVINGRSPSMELGAPQNQKTKYIFDPNGTADTAGAQIIDDVLEGTMLGIDDTGWSVDWSAYGPNIISGFDPYSAADWGIPPNTFSWDGLTQIEVIKQLTDSIGAFIMTDPNCNSTNKILHVKPIINSPPWHWNTANIYRPNIDHAISTNYGEEVGRSYKKLPDYTAVYVIGQNSASPQGGNTLSGLPVTEVSRAGANKIYAQDITNQWLTSTAAQSEIGRVTISETGDWIDHSIRLFSLEQKDNLTPTITGLVLPGEFVQMEERGNTWYGTVTSTSITASVVNVSAFAVNQVIEVSQYIGE